MSDLNAQDLLIEHSEYLLLVNHYLEDEERPQKGLTKQDIISILRPDDIADDRAKDSSSNGLIDLLGDSFDCAMAQKQVRVSDTNLFEDALEYFETLQLPFIKRGKFYHLNPKFLSVPEETNRLPNLLDSVSDAVRPTSPSTLANDKGHSPELEASPEPPYAEPPLFQSVATRQMPDLFEMLDINIEQADKKIERNEAVEKSENMGWNYFDGNQNGYFGLMLDWFSLADTIG